ncbi:hypothetical protein P4K91_09705 [Bacillus anthracis]|uniref:hypothetical protein n=1 Tax=Bacillus cereus group TaxID=86661 RepID=UPI001E2BE069|nr:MULTISPECIES: hypothetical protein [Bacillus cereus group]MEB9905634.1 hypothetical protein [Bacillus anthracis]MEC1956576.1 hypothetical protein [Bacillus anthracis]
MVKFSSKDKIQAVKRYLEGTEDGKNTTVIVIVNLATKRIHLALYSVMLTLISSKFLHLNQTDVYSNVKTKFKGEKS